MNVSIDSMTIQPAQSSQAPRTGGRTGGPSEGSTPDRRFEDCLAEMSTPTGTPPRVLHSRSRGHESDTDDTRDDDRTRAHRATTEGPPVVPQSATPVPTVQEPSSPATDAATPATDDAAASATAAATSNVTPGGVDLGILDPALLEATADALADPDLADAVAAALAESATAGTAADAAQEPVADVAAVAPPSTEATEPTSAGGTATPTEQLPPDVPATAPRAADAASDQGRAASSGNPPGLEQVPGAPGAANRLAAAARRSAAAGGAANDPAATGALGASAAKAANQSATSASSGSSATSSVDHAAAVTGTPPTIVPQGPAVALETAAAPGAVSVPTPLAMAAAPGSAPGVLAAGPLRLDVDLGGEGLGPMRMRARTIGNELHVSLSAADAHVRATLLSHSNGLRRDLEAAGLDVGSLNVGSSPDQQFGPDGGADTNGGSSQAGDSHQARDRGVSHQTRTRPETRTSSTTPVRPVSSRLDLKL